MSDNIVTSTCTICEKQFSYTVNGDGRVRRRGPTYLFRKICDACRGERRVAITKAWKQKHREKYRNAAPMEEVHGFRQHARAPILHCTHQELAKKLKMSTDAVRDLERKVLHKIRNNPELKNLWDIFKEEGMPVPEGSFFGTDQGWMLLDYQMAVMDWWQIHDQIVETGGTAAAMECLSEIQNFQRVIADCLGKL